MYFVTGSKNKFQEAQLVIPDLQQVELDLPEIQELDPYKVIAAKLEAAFNEVHQPVIVEDTSLYLPAMNGLPGPLIKWFLSSIGCEGIVKMAHAFTNTEAIAKTIIGFTIDGVNFDYFEGVVEGRVVNPRGNYGFGWDPIFEVKTATKTFAEMLLEEKSNYSMRKLAFQKLQEYLDIAQHIYLD